MASNAEFKLLLASSEVVGFAKTGGLADVAGSLPPALSHRGPSCAVLMPLYRCIRTANMPLSPTEHRFQVPIGNRTVSGRIWQCNLPSSDVPVYLIEQADYFERDDPSQGRGLYQLTLPDGQKRDYPDNCERYIFFCRAVLESMRLLDYWPHVLHLNDWQTGLVPVYLRETYGRKSGYDSVRTLFTIHNIAYQGQFWHWDMLLTGLDWKLFNYRQLEFYGQLNFLKAGIVFADLISTVSPTYAREIQTPYYGAGLDGVLSERKDRLFGIVNGVDYQVWDPARDPHLAARYDAHTVAEGKAQCKMALQRRFGIPERPDVPLLGVVARLAEQKGIDLVCGAAGKLLQHEVQLVVLGDGDQAYQKMLEELRKRFPDKVGLVFAFDESLAHQVEGGADLFLMPSLYEPAGLNQLYSLKYGTVPVVRATGGLADTIIDATATNLAAGRATGFTFVARTAAALEEAVRRALDLYHHHPTTWRALIQTGMRQDWSWDRIAGEYEVLYSRLREVD